MHARVRACGCMAAWLLLVQEVFAALVGATSAAAAAAEVAAALSCLEDGDDDNDDDASKWIGRLNWSPSTRPATTCWLVHLDVRDNSLGDDGVRGLCHQLLGEWVTSTGLGSWRGARRVCVCVCIYLLSSARPRSALGARCVFVAWHWYKQARRLYLFFFKPTPACTYRYWRSQPFCSYSYPLYSATFLRVVLLLSTVLACCISIQKLRPTTQYARNAHD
jgi:hypothetical protein